MGLQTARFDVLKVWDPTVNLYVNVVEALEDLQTQIKDLSTADTGRSDALEAKAGPLGLAMGNRGAGVRIARDPHCNTKRKTWKLVGGPLHMDYWAFCDMLASKAPEFADVQLVERIPHRKRVAWIFLATTPKELDSVSIQKEVDEVDYDMIAWPLGVYLEAR